MANETLGKVSLSDSAIYQTVLEGMSSGVVVITLDGRIEYLNPAAEALLGLDVAAVRGERLRAYVDPSDEMDRLGGRVAPSHSRRALIYRALQGVAASKRGQ